MRSIGDATDAELLASADDRNVAFAELYQRHVEAVLAYFMRRTGCAQTAADLTAETFAAALIARRRFRDTGAPGRAWLFKIAQRQLAHFVRREAVSERARRRAGMERLILDSDDLDRVEQMVDFAPYQDAIGAAMSALPTNQREAVRLRIGDGLPYREVADALGCSEGAARVRVTRGLRALAGTMGEA